MMAEFGAPLNDSAFATSNILSPHLRVVGLDLFDLPQAAAGEVVRYCAAARSACIAPLALFSSLPPSRKRTAVV